MIDEKQLSRNSILLLDEASEILRCSVKTVRRLISEGRLGAFRVRGSLRVTYGQVQAYRRREIEEFTESTPSFWN